MHGQDRCKAAERIGLYLVPLAKQLGVGQVIALASSEEKLKLVQSLGADVAVNYDLPDCAKRVRTATEEVDVILQTTSGELGSRASSWRPPSEE